MQFDLADLRLMAAIAETDSLTRGAERAYTSVSAASIRIKNLEERIGAKLLYRSSQGVKLSPPGQAFAHHARLVLSQLQHLNNDLQEYARGVKGHLRVFASTTAVTEFLPRVLSRYLAAHPDVNIDLKERLSTDIVRAVSEGQADIGVVSGTARTEGLEVKPYREDRLVLMVPEEHDLAGQGSVAFADTLDFEHIGLHEGSAIHTFLDQMAREANRSLRLRIQVGNFEAASRMVEAGVGVGVMPESAASRYALQARVRVVALADAWARRDLQICVRRFDDLPGFAKDLVTLLERDAHAVTEPAEPA
jgi:DNA-binding transcriptional LysR family regulator